MTDSKRAFKQIRDLSRAAALAGPETATRSRASFFVALAHEVMLRVVGSTVGNPQAAMGELSRLLGREDRYCDQIAALPASCLIQSTFIGWAYQIWNEPVRDANSWAVSKKAEGRHEDVDIAAVTQVFTDEYIADFLVSRCIDLWRAAAGQRELVPTICDPALGTGHILVSAVRAFVARGMSVNSIADRLLGFDIDSLSVFIARTAVFCELIRIGYSQDPIVLWEKLGRTLKALSAPYGSLDRASCLTEEPATFDIIVTNPPYLGRRKLPSAFRDFLDREYPATSVDLCAAFLQRCVELLAPDGMLGVVTSDKWIRLNRYATVRRGGKGFAGLFGALTIDGIYELGNRAFVTVSDLHDGMRVALLVGRKAAPPLRHRLAYVTLAEISPYERKQEALFASVVEGASAEYVTRVGQSELAKGGDVFLTVSGLPSQFTNMMHRLGDKANIVVGVQTNDDARFVKYVWQVSADRSSWRVHSKGGGYGRWSGLQHWVIDWRGGASEFFERDSARERAESWAKKDGWVYSWFANGSLGLRRKYSGWTFGRAASGGVFTEDRRVVAFMNSRLASAAARSIGGKIQLPEGTVKAIPAPISLEPIQDSLVAHAVQLKEAIVASDPTEALFCPRSMLKPSEILFAEALLLVVEGILEQQVEQSIGLNRAERTDLIARLGMVAGWYSLQVGIENHPVLERIPQQWREIVTHCLARSPDIFLSGSPRPSIEVVSQINDLRRIDSCTDRRWLLPSTGVVETICRAFHLHPFDALLTAEELIQHSQGIRRKVCGDHLARGVLVELLSRLGHRWWSESEVSKDKCNEKLSYDEVCSIVDEQVSREGYGDVVKGVGAPLEGWVRHPLVEFNHTYFFGQSSLVFEPNSVRYRTV